MELSDFIINITVFGVFYFIGANHKQYLMARDWSDSHPTCNISFYEDWIQNAKHFCKLNYMNTCCGFLGRKIAYKIHQKNDPKRMPK